MLPEIRIVVTSMGKFSTTNLRFLYLLALFQLVAGPLVLFQVTVLCKLTVREAPGNRVTTAVSKAWHSPEFQATLADDDGLKSASRKSPLPTSDPKAKIVKVKTPAIAWQATPIVLVNLSERITAGGYSRVWTPAWPQAPPGPPPRLG
ncbi:MAG: hypothetical protein ABI600_18225 [Luteolibacter sp.]